jgi:hypothetical protein
MAFLWRFVSVPLREQVFVSIPGFVSIITTWIFVALCDRAVCGLVPGPSPSPIKVRGALAMNGGVATPSIWPSGGIESVHSLKLLQSARAPCTSQDIIATLNRFWTEQGCLILQAYETEKAAGTMSPRTVLRAIGPAPWDPTACRSISDTDAQESWRQVLGFNTSTGSSRAFRRTRRTRQLLAHPAKSFFDCLFIERVGGEDCLAIQVTLIPVFRDTVFARMAEAVFDITEKPVRMYDQNSGISRSPYT